mgnify:FL=1
MKITKYKKVGKNRYNVYLEDSQICLYEEIILKYNLLLKSDINIEELSNMIDENKYYEAYHMLLSYIEVKLRNKKELIKYLEKKEFDNKYIDFAINKIEELGLLNNKVYIECFINDKVNLGYDGPYKIKRELIDNGFSSEEIEAYLCTFDDKVWEDKINKIIEKKLKTLKNKSSYMIINKLKIDLYNMGYDKDMISNKLSNINIDNSNIINEFNKASKKYKDKNKIINYLLRKGYSYSEVNDCFERE